MSSNRLPGKSLADIGGEPMLVLFLHRLERAQRIARIVVATSEEAVDDPVAAVARDLGITTHRGSRDLSHHLPRDHLVARDVHTGVTADHELDVTGLDPVAGAVGGQHLARDRCARGDRGRCNEAATSQSIHLARLGIAGSLELPLPSAASTSRTPATIAFSSSGSSAKGWSGPSISRESV